jgi:biopolymer transport protein ExbD
MIEPGKSRADRSRGLIAVTIAMLALVLLSVQLVRADQAQSAKQAKQESQDNETKPRTIPVSLNKGETYVISGFRGIAKIKVVENANALAVQSSAPGKIVLVGSDNGSWKLDVTLNSGEKVTYVMSVRAAGTPQGSLMPGAAPTVIP